MRSRLSRRLTLASVIVAALLGAAGAAYAAFVATTANGPSSLQATSSFPRCYRDAVNADNPVSHWKLNETSGTTAADSAGANNGTYAGGVTLAQPGALADPENKAPSFDGTNDQVVVSDAAGLRPAQISVEAWVKRASGTAQWASPVMKTSNDDWADGYGLYFTTDGNVHFFVNNWDLYDVATTLPADQWTHLVGTYDGATIKLYKNGAQVASLAFTAPINHSTADLLIGNAAVGHFWQSGIDEVAVYGSALSASRIQAHYNAGLCYRDEVLADTPGGYWKLDEAAGTVTAFDGENTNHGTYKGGVTLAQPGALTDSSNKAPSFDGTNDQVVVSDAPGLRPAQISVEAWVKRTSGTTQWASPVMKTSNDSWTDGYGLYFKTDGNAHFFVNDYDLYDVATTLPADQWTHLVGTYDGATIKLYKNGAQVASLALTAPINHSTADLLIGNAAGDGYFWQSGIDEVAVYGSALSASRIQAHYNAGIR